MSLRVHYEILNQKGTPAFFSDTYANRPTYGFAGRVFISTDTGQIFEDTGSAWTLIADAGVGGGTLASVTANGNTTATGIVITAGGLSTDSLTDTALTTGSVLFSGTGGLVSQKNANLFWDNTNNRLGIGINSPGAPLDIHSTGTNAQFNGTGTNNAYLQFQNAGTSKWRIGNTYNAGANTFDIYNNGTATNALSFNVTTNAATFINSITATSLIKSGGTSGQFLKADGSVDSSTYLTTGTASSTYLALTGGTLTGGLYINPTNTGTIGLDVASDTVRFRSDNLEGFKRALTMVMGSGTLIQMTAAGFGGTYSTDISFLTSSSSGINSSPNIYMSGNLFTGIGTSSPAYTLDVQYGGTIYQRIRNTTAGGTSTLLLETANTFSGTSQSYIQCIGSGGNGTSQLAFAVGTTSGSSTGTEVMRLNSSGNLLIGTTTGSGKLIVNQTATSVDCVQVFANTGGTGYYYSAGGNSGYFGYMVTNLGVAGTILCAGNTTTYATSSDYRLKTDLKDFNGLNLISQIKTYDYEWISNKTRSYGVLAHELQEVIPNAVVGEKDNEQMQGVDYSKIVPILVKSIQELNEKLTRNNIN